MPAPVSPASSSPRTLVDHRLLFALLSTLVCAVCWWWPQVMSFLGVGHGGVWFRDTETLLHSIVVHRHGIDPYTLPYDTQHWYSHWWLWLEPTGVTRADSVRLGALIAGATLVTVWFVAAPRNGREVAWTLVMFCSPPILLGLNRGNVDLVLFVLLSPAIPALVSRHRLSRIAVAPPLLALTTGLKYFPAVGGLVLLAARPPRERLATLALYGVLLTGTLLNVAPDIQHYTSAAPVHGFYTLGAPVSFQLFDLPTLVSLALTVAVLAVGGWRLKRTRALRNWEMPADLRREYLYFILGAVILTACFVLTVNYAYRWIFGFWLLPFLLRLPPDPRKPVLEKFRKLTLGLLLASLWVEAVAVAVLNLAPPSVALHRFWENASGLLKPGLAWLFFACLSAWLIHFVLTQWRGGPTNPAGPQQTVPEDQRRATG